MSNAQETMRAERDWGRRLILPALRQQRRRRRRAAVDTARRLGHRLSRWIILCQMRQVLYGGDGGDTSAWMWSCICLDCGHRLSAVLHPYWVAVDGIPEDQGMHGCAATWGIEDPCPAARSHQLTLFDEGERDTPRIPLSVMEAIGGLPAPVTNVGTPKRPRLVVFLHTVDIDPATDLCRQCGHSDGDHSTESRRAVAS